jgi:hypothetical protein
MSTISAGSGSAVAVGATVAVAVTEVLCAVGVAVIVGVSAAGGVGEGALSARSAGVAAGDATVGVTVAVGTIGVI